MKANTIAILAATGRRVIPTGRGHAVISAQDRFTVGTIRASDARRLALIDAAADGDIEPDHPALIEAIEDLLLTD